MLFCDGGAHLKIVAKWAGAAAWAFALYIVAHFVRTIISMIYGGVGGRTVHIVHSKTGRTSQI